MGMPDLPIEFPPSRKAALDRLQAFVPLAGKDYASTRNTDLGSFSKNGVSGLSPYLRRRVITEKEVCDSVLERHGPEAAEKFLQEVCWRTYWKGWLELRPDVWTAYIEALEKRNHECRHGAEWGKRLDQTREGESGISCMDHWVEELRQAGYLHNHVRMWFAGIWVYTLGLPWELGADFFARHLLDGDPASNTLSWRWVAGLQTKGKRYKPLASNIHRYTGGRFKLSGDPARISNGPDYREPPRPASLDTPATPLPEPFTLLLCAEDWAMDLPSELAQGAKRVILLNLEEWPATWTPSRQVIGFEDAVRRDALRLWKTVAPVEEWTFRELAERMGELRDSPVVFPAPPCGPRRDRLHGIIHPLDFQPVRWCREWDRLMWPHAKAGFFSFWKKIRKGIF
jgi:deoxyribodipyrimidine photo-lyase